MQLKVIRRSKSLFDEEPVQLSFQIEIKDLSNQEFLKDVWGTLLKYSARNIQPIEREIKEVTDASNNTNTII